MNNRILIMTNLEIQKAYVGSTEVSKIYLGAELIYPTTPPGPAYSAMPLTFEIISGGTLYWRTNNKSLFDTVSPKTIEYSTDDGATWTEITSASGTAAPTISVSAGDTVQFRGNNTQLAESSTVYSSLFGDSNVKFNVYGNINSLLSKDNYTGITSYSSAYTFYNLFGTYTATTYNPGLISAENLVLTAPTLANYCYGQLFHNCTSLTTPPKLPATTLAAFCYNGMFQNCTSLTGVPSNYLPATTLADYCYRGMFMNCTSLTTTPVLSATTLVGGCYQEMFAGCTSLTSLPNLPADYLGDNCYNSMFANCTSLTGVPSNYLPVTSLTTNCYTGMFSGCTSLTSLPNLPATTLNTSCYDSMFEGCTSLTGVPSNYLPATTLASNCYYEMFADCTNLTSLPSLPADDLRAACYYGMFKGCTSLTGVPSNYLSVTRLASQCYSNMFSGCTSLTSLPNLPATTLEQSCYSGMFKGTPITGVPSNYLQATTMANTCYGGMFGGCTALTAAPELPATTLAYNCYNGMFTGCTSLTTAPELPATTLVNQCYYGMFKGCTNLNYIKCMAIYTVSNATSQWVSGVSSTGTFVKNSSMTSWTAGVNGIPNGWVVENAGETDEYVTKPLTFEILSSGTIYWVANKGGFFASVYVPKTIEYSLDSGQTWTSITSASGSSAPSISVSAGDTVQFRGNNTQIGSAVSMGYASSTLSGDTNLKFNAYGNVNSLLDKQNFSGITSLSSGYTFPKLFLGDTGLISAEYLRLPAITLQQNCYEEMFSGCTSLTTGPVLPAPTLAAGCYNIMFGGCSNLNYIKCMATNISASNCTSGWVTGVSATGTFVKNSIMSSWTTGTNGIPAGWTVQNA